MSNLFSRRNFRETGRSFFGTFGTLIILLAFLSPMLRVVTTALKTPEQVMATGSPVWPAKPAVLNYEGKDYDIYTVPTESGNRDLALYKKGREESIFLNPANPSEQIVWKGAWRTLQRSWQFSPAWDNFGEVWRLIDFPRLLYNTIAIAIISTTGTLASCILVAYGFARFRIPGKGFLFTLLISTIFLPGSVTLIPTYTVFAKIGWVGTWLPLLVPTFFANAYDVFLLRQYFLTIPREMDEAAMIDGAGPLRILFSIILPQSWPVVISVAIFHIVYAWNDYFGPLIYLSTKPELQPIAVGLSRFNGIHYTNPSLIQAATLMTMAIPLVIFLFCQRFFMQGVVVTGVEK
ncbi:MAG TPA: carbohydrate ABC transporter permease [Anaerolineaceae bacterium]|nr:carbohydrate ABC transporter permease [Anaerolineaceae bacterium]HPN51244.1 carbohydrate ABC transporter permease [Anaerolineaceae bacterium]